MINKKNIWFLTLFSLILVLSVYYITMPSELLLTNFTGKELERKIRQYNIETEFIETNRGYTRINVKISSLEKNSLIQESETALNGNGPEITENDIEKLLQKIQNINSNDIVILSGNIPKCINENIYEIICKELDGKNVKFVVDASQKLLMNCLKYKPFFIKPNKEELAETFNTKIETKEEEKYTYEGLEQGKKYNIKTKGVPSGKNFYH